MCRFSLYRTFLKFLKHWLGQCFSNRVSRHICVSPKLSNVLQKVLNNPFVNQNDPFLSLSILFFCVANKNSELKGVAALKRLRTTALERRKFYRLFIPTDKGQKCSCYRISKSLVGSNPVVQRSPAHHHIRLRTNNKVI